jgi:uncharacterized membrane protein YozB (DUF420 family)
MGTDGIVALVALAAWLMLAWRSYRSHQVPRHRTLIMAACWVAIFVFLVFAIRSLGFGHSDVSVEGPIRRIAPVSI